MTWTHNNPTTHAPVGGQYADQQGAAMPPHVRFDHIEATWEAAGRFAEQWLPPLSGSADSREMIFNAKQLILAVILHVRLAYAPCHQHLSTVKQLLEAEARQPGCLFTVMRQSPERHVVHEASRAQEHQANPWFGGLRQALLCVRDWP